MISRRLSAVLAIVLASVASTIAAAPAAATQDSGIPVVVTVYASGQAPLTEGTTIGALEQGCPTSTVDPTLQGPDGTPEPGNQPTAQEWALATLLSSTSPACLPTPIPISAVADVIVLESNGLADPNAAARLTPADLTLPSDFADSSQWPVFWDEGSAVIYERPTRDANDDNATDQVIVTPGSGESLQFDVYEGAASVNVTISASATSVAPGSSVTFTASVPGADSGETFVWNFDGAAPAAIGSSVSATFANAGVYEVSVQATGTKNGFGQIEVDVGSTPAGTGTTTTPTGAVNGSGTNAGASAITPGASGITPGVSGTTPSVSSTTPSATTHKRTPNPKHKSTGATQTPASVVTVVRHVKGSGSSTGSGSAGTGSGAPLRAGGGVRPKGSGPPASGPAATAKRNDAVVVRGRLLGSLASPTAGTDRSQTARSSEAQRVNLPASGWPWAAILGGLVVVALLGLGARRELHAIRFAP